MSRLAVLIAVPAVLAVAGLAVVALDLSGQVTDLEARLADLESRAPRDAATSAASDDAPRASMSRADQARVRTLEERVREVETQLVVAQPAAGSVPQAALSGANDAAVDASPAPGDPAFRRAVEDVLEAREAERRLERLTRMADARTRQLLRGVTVSDTQRSDVLRVIGDGLRRRDEARDLDLEPELERQRNEELRGELVRGLEGILDAGQMDAVRPRLDMRRGGDAGRRGDGSERGNGGGRRRGGRPADDA